jgi:hypothetical protein
MKIVLQAVFSHFKILANTISNLVFPYHFAGVEARSNVGEPAQGLGVELAVVRREETQPHQRGHARREASDARLQLRQRRLLRLGEKVLRGDEARRRRRRRRSLRRDLAEHAAHAGRVALVQLLHARHHQLCNTHSPLCS